MEVATQRERELVINTNKIVRKFNVERLLRDKTCEHTISLNEHTMKMYSSCDMNTFWAILLQTWFCVNLLNVAMSVNVVYVIVDNCRRWKLNTITQMCALLSVAADCDAEIIRLHTATISKLQESPLLMELSLQRSFKSLGSLSILLTRSSNL